MTGKERLYIGGLCNDFDTCTKKKDIEGIKAILKKVETDKDTIVEIINSLKLND